MKIKMLISATLVFAKTCHLTAQPTNPPSATNSAPAVETAFNVNGYHVDGNTVLPAEKLDFLTNYTG
ncbi:MAG: hypothetical protein ABSG59_23090, partial [Verrucomicrobiota bacterium]